MVSAAAATAERLTNSLRVIPLFLLIRFSLADSSNP
jgi:hypothetical protein